MWGCSFIINLFQKDEHFCVIENISKVKMLQKKEEKHAER